MYTFYVQMNVTVSLDDRLLERARELARKKDTSLNQMIRDYLEEVTASSSPEHLLEDLERMWREDYPDSGEREWKPEEERPE